MSAALGVVFAALFAGRPSAGEPLRAGACQVDITPTRFPVCVNGYFTPRYVSEVHDPLYAKALAI
ncbi:MAG: hypothetical protein J6S75_02590, partial [Thermoguttaceae bacterium]|nr:hypothetical protein [Thermoguttaceae bacterium]